MYGFNIIQNGKGLSGSSKIISYGNIICENHMISKFEEDKIFFQDEKYIIILDGIIFNKTTLQTDNNWYETIIALYERNGDCFFEDLRGSFAGALYDKEQGKWIIFTDHLGSKFIYYSFVGGVFICSLMMDNMYKLLMNNNIRYHLDVTGAFMELSYGFMLEDYTLCEEIKKIQPGDFIVIKDGNLSVHSYFKLKNEENDDLDEQSIIDNIEKLFSAAVCKQFEKDKEYGYKHIVALSGGLDARMTSFVAHENGYKNQLNCTFSQTDYLDETVAKEMASFMKHEWIFKSLDNGLWLYDVDESNQLTGGNVFYSSLAHGHSLVKCLNFDHFGLVHTGQLGDVTISTHCRKDEVYHFGDGAYSKGICDLYSFNFANQNMDKEIGIYYNRLLNGTNNGIQYLYNYTESYSPFMDLDFLSFALSIPNKYRANHYIYKKWVLQKHPDASKFIWESTGAKIDALHIKISGRPYPIKKIIRRGLQAIHILATDANSKHNMNPTTYYFNNNRDLYDYVMSYFRYLDLIKDQSLKTVLVNIRDKGTSLEKIQAITLLGALKLYYQQ